MKANVELSTNVVYAIANDAANKAAVGWLEGAGVSRNCIPRETAQMLYQYAYADGMEDLIKMLNEK